MINVILEERRDIARNLDKCIIGQTFDDQQDDLAGGANLCQAEHRT